MKHCNHWGGDRLGPAVTAPDAAGCPCSSWWWVCLDSQSNTDWAPPQKGPKGGNALAHTGTYKTPGPLAHKLRQAN